jgi:hypothetical protein
MGARTAEHELHSFIVKTFARVLFTIVQLGLCDSAISCLEIEGILFSSFDIAFAMWEGGPRSCQK